MNETFESKIKRLKDELQIAEHANQLWKILIEKRGMLESKITKLMSEIDDNKNSIYCNTSKDLCVKQIIETKEETLKKIKCSKQEIDEKLDEIEGVSEEIIEDLKRQLILAILQNHPEQKDEFKKLDFKCTSCEKLAKELKILTDW